MNSHESLTISLSKLQDSSLNAGGMWTVRMINRDNLTARELLIKLFASSPKFLSNSAKKSENVEFDVNGYKQTKNINLIEIENWRTYLSERIDYWSEFELMSKEIMMLKFQKDVFNDQKNNFLQCLNQELNNDQIKFYKLDETSFDTYHLWNNQIQEDFVFEMKHSLLIINLGWSS